MKEKQDLPNLDRSESGLTYFGDITVDFEAITDILDNKITITIDPKYLVPEDVLFTWDNWQKVKNNTFILHPTEDNLEAIYFDDRDPLQESNFVNNLNNTSHWDAELKRYVKAYRFIFNLLLRSGEIEISGKPSQTEIAFDILNKSINNNSIWLEYYLLDNKKLLKRLNLTPPKKREYKPGKVEAKQYEYICELFKEAQNSENSLTTKRYLCNWLLTYSSPAQIWFGLQVHHLKKQWIKKTTPGAVKTKELAFKEEKEILETIQKELLNSEEKELDSKQKKSRKINLEVIEDKNAEDLSFNETFLFTTVKFQELYKSDNYPELIKARRAKNNYIRKGGKSDGTGIQVLKTDKKGNLLLGNRKIEFDDTAT